MAKYNSFFIALYQLLLKNHVTYFFTTRIFQVYHHVKGEFHVR